MWYRTLLVVLTVAVSAQVWYPFSPNPFRLRQSEWLGDTTTTAITESRRITIRDGHFATASGERIRLLAATITGASCYPDRTAAKAMAAWIRAIGYNAVVLRLWDYTGAGGNYPLLWRYGTRRSSQPFDQAQLDKLLYLMAELRRNGLYIALTCDGFIPLPDDGVSGVDSIQFPWNVRYIQFVDSIYSIRHRSVLQRLLTTYNPYTGLRVGDDPALALLLLPDNNSLFAWWKSPGLQSYLPPSQQQKLRAAWNAYLRQRYGTTNQLKVAWRTVPRSTDNRITDGSFEDFFAQSWILATSTGTQAILDFSDADKIHGSRSARIRISPNAVGTNPWDVLLYQTGATLEPHTIYRLEFWAKTTNPQGKTIRISILRNGYPWEELGLNKDLTITSSWQRYAVDFIATDSVPAFIGIGVGGSQGDVFLDSVALAARPTEGLRQGESIEQATVLLLPPDSTTTPERLRDATQFLTMLQERYYAGMYQFIRETLGLRILVGGGTDFAAANDLVALKKLDFTTASVGNGGIYNYTGPNSQWYASSDGSLDALWGSTIYLASLAALEGKPLFIASYTIPYPCPFINEILTYAPSYCLYQDWDGIAVYNTFSWNNQPPWDRIIPNSFWSTEAVYSLHALIPGIRRAFLIGAIQPSTDQVRIQLSRDILEHPYLQRSAYYLPSPTDSRIPFFRTIRFDSLNAHAPSFMPHLLIPDFNREGGLDLSAMLADREQLHWNQHDGWLRINTPRFIGFHGRMRNFIGTYRDGITLEHTGTAQMASLVWASLDSLPIASSQRSLLILSTRTQNEGARWTENISLWQGWGDGTTQLEATTIAVTFPSRYDSLSVIPIGDNGQPLSNVTVPIQRVRGGFRFVIDQRQVPTPWFAIKQYHLLNRSEDASSEDITVYPNPLTTPRGNIILPEDWSGGTVEVWDIRGSCVWVQDVEAGRHIVSFDDIGSGFYLVTAKSGAQVWRHPIVVCR